MVLPCNGFPVMGSRGSNRSRLDAATGTGFCEISKSRSNRKLLVLIRVGALEECFRMG